MIETRTLRALMTGNLAALGGILAMTTIGCGGGAAAEATAAKAPGGDQASVGAKLYGAKCASCHGAGGEGTDKAPPVVGKAALPLDPPATAKKRTAQFHTAADVFAFVKANMPGGAPGSLTDDEYAAILAFDLKANGVDVTGKTIDATTAPAIVLHP